MNTRVLAYSRALLVVMLLLGMVLNAMWLGVNITKLRDYGSFIAAGKAATRGENPYGTYEETFRVHYYRFDVDSPNLNPPISIYPFQLLARVDWHAGKAALDIVSITIFAGVVLALLKAYPEKRTPLMLLWIASLAGVWHSMELGQIYMPLLAATTAAWLMLDRRPLLAGVLIGLAIVFKPNFAVWPALLLLGGDRKTSISAFATAAGISAIPLIVDGPGVYRQWLEASRDFAGLEMPGNSAIIAIFARIGLDGVGVVASIATAVGLAAYALKGGASKRDLSALGILGALLLGPITWSGYSLFALPILMSRRWGGWEKASAAFFAFPVWLLLALMMTNTVTYVLIGPIYGWGLLILFALYAADAYRRLRPSPQNEAAPSSDERAALVA